MRKQGKAITAVASVAVLVGLGACGIGLAGTASGDALESPPDLDAGPVVAETNPTGDKVKTDKFDNVEKGPGEKAGLVPTGPPPGHDVDARTNKSYFTIEVTNSEVVGQCDPRVGIDKLKPTRTAFLVLDITATLDANVSKNVGGDGGELYMPLVAETFSVAGSNGAPDRNVTSETAWGCFDDAVLLPPVVNPGQSVTGKLVLDVDAVTGQVTYDPENNGGWSWPYGE